jgi:hypothetical protein
MSHYCILCIITNSVMWAKYRGRDLCTPLFLDASKCSPFLSNVSTDVLSIYLLTYLPTHPLTQNCGAFCASYWPPVTWNLLIVLKITHLQCLSIYVLFQFSTFMTSWMVSLLQQCTPFFQNSLHTALRYDSCFSNSDPNVVWEKRFLFLLRFHERVHIVKYFFDLAVRYFLLCNLFNAAVLLHDVNYCRTYNNRGCLDDRYPK